MHKSFNSNITNRKWTFKIYALFFFFFFFNLWKIRFFRIFCWDGRRDKQNGSASLQISSPQVPAERRMCECVHVKETEITQRNNAELAKRCKETVNSNRRWTLNQIVEIIYYEFNVSVSSIYQFQVLWTEENFLKL